MKVRKKLCRKFGKKTDLEELLKKVTEENKKKRLLRNKTEFFKLVSCIKLCKIAFEEDEVLFQTVCGIIHSFLYKNKSLDFGKNFLEQVKSKTRLAVTQNIRTKCIG